jgi:hypothetical protein
MQKGTAREKVPRKDVVSLLEILDRAWSTFECQYVHEMIAIEATARKPLETAVKYAKNIPAKEKGSSYGTWCVSLEQDKLHQKMLFARIAELNVMANTARKGRGDINENALQLAMKVVNSRTGYENSSQLVRDVCEDLLASFSGMCRYLRLVNMESVDPMLKNNPGLVERLADLEEAWETVTRYVEDEAMRSTLDAVASTLTRTQELVPAFAQMCSECDAELFLVIPRVIWFTFLKDSRQDAILKSLLPHVFEDSECKLQGLLDDFEARVQESPLFVDALMHQIVQGPGSEANGEHIPKAYHDRIQAFARELESWSIELQRHQARDWNLLCAVLVHNLFSDYKKGTRKISCV